MNLLSESLKEYEKLFKSIDEKEFPLKPESKIKLPIKLINTKIVKNLENFNNDISNIQFLKNSNTEMNEKLKNLETDLYNKVKYFLIRLLKLKV